MLLDTCVVIDALRGSRGAIQFVSTLVDVPYISAVTVTELFAGFRSQKSERVARSFLADCRLLDVNARIAESAGTILRHYKAGSGLDVPDALIAATAEHHGLPLATLNVKHFPMFAKLKPAY